MTLGSLLTETHITEWALWVLARPEAAPIVPDWRCLDAKTIEQMEAEGFRASRSACSGGYLTDTEAISYHMPDAIPTCPRCAVLRAEALEGRLPKRGAA